MKKNSYVKRMMKVVVMLMSLVGIPVMIVLLAMPNRTYGSYMGHIYELNYWWQTLILVVAIACIICRLRRRSQHINAIIRMIALASVMTVVAVVIKQSWWGVVRLCDGLTGSGNGVFVFLMSPIFLFLLWCVCGNICEFVACDNVKEA